MTFLFCDVHGTLIGGPHDRDAMLQALQDVSPEYVVQLVSCNVHNASRELGGVPVQDKADVIRKDLRGCVWIDDEDFLLRALARRGVTAVHVNHALEFLAGIRRPVRENPVWRRERTGTTAEYWLTGWEPDAEDAGPISVLFKGRPRLLVNARRVARDRVRLTFADGENVTVPAEAPLPPYRPPRHNRPRTPRTSLRAATWFLGLGGPAGGVPGMARIVFDGRVRELVDVQEVGRGHVVLIFRNGQRENVPAMIQLQVVEGY